MYVGKSINRYACVCVCVCVQVMNIYRRTSMNIFKEVRRLITYRGLLKTCRCDYSKNVHKDSGEHLKKITRM